MSRRPRASTRDRALAREPRVPQRQGREPHRSRPPTRDVVAAATLGPRRSRRRWLGVKITSALAVVVATGVFGGQWVLHQSFFRVHHVTLTGERHETAAQILAATHLDAHPAMIDLSEATMRNELSAYPWIGSISLVKRWPSTVNLAVHEVSAVAVAFDPRHVLRYVDVAGRDLGSAPSNVNMPTLATSPKSLAATSWPFQGPESAAALVAGSLPVAFSAQVNHILVDAQGNVTLQMTSPIEFFLGAATNLRAKFVAVASAIAHGTYVAGDLVDVTTPSELSVTGPAPS